MKIKIALLMLFLLTISVCAYAEFTQEIELQNGTILTGHISRQRPGKDIVFYVKNVLKDPNYLYSQKERSYVISWKEVKNIRNMVSSYASWANDKITLKTGVEYIGQIDEQEVGYTMSIRLKDSDKLIRVKNSEIEKTEKVALEFGGNLWNERPYTNRIVLRDKTTHKGLIVLQYMGKTANDSYIELLLPRGKTERIYIPDIREYYIDVMK